MLPVVDKPAIQYVVEEAVAAGIDDILVIIGRNKNALANHFDRVTELEHTLEQKGDHGKLARVMEPSSLADIHFVRQGDPKGLGHAVLRARKHVGHETFAVMLGDDLIDARDPLLSRMIEVSLGQSATVVALMEVDPSQIHLYGCADVEATTDADVVRIKALVEKPSAAEAPSNLAIIGRYVLKPEIFDVLENTEPGKGGEIQLTDALEELAADESIAGPGARRDLLRPPLRHGRPARLPEVQHPARPRPRRSRAGAGFVDQGDRPDPGILEAGDGGCCASEGHARSLTTIIERRRAR